MQRPRTPFVTTLLSVVLFNFGMWCYCKDKVMSAEEDSRKAEVTYLRTYHDWRLTHPENEVVGVMFMVPKAFADRVDRWRQFLPPCGPVHINNGFKTI